MLTGIDISHHQTGFSIPNANPGFCIVKATEGTTYVDKMCDSFVQECRSLGIPWGFYHFANGADNAAAQARFFRDQTKGYENQGIPVLDFENAYSNSWIDEFVKEYHAITGVFPWVYMNSDYVNNHGYGSDYVKANCGLWLSGYPRKYTAYPADTDCPYKHDGWTLAAWQFTSSLSMGGMSIDGDIFYGDVSAWNRYANPNGATGSDGSGSSGVISGSDYEVARRVINGEFGAGAARERNLGSRYSAVQAAVNMLLLGSNEALAKEVIAGKLGNGETRKVILGSRYSAVQSVVNRML